MTLESYLRNGPEPANSFDRVVNQNTLHLFHGSKRSSASLLAAGIYKGNYER